MSQPAASRAPSESTQTSLAPDTRLHGRWLRLARVGWLVVVIVTLALFVGSLPAYYRLLQVPCVGSVECSTLGGLLDAPGLQALRAAGFSASGYAALTIVLTLAIELIWAGVGLVIFWRRSEDWVALLAALALVVFYAAGQGQATTALIFTSPAWTVPVEGTTFLSQAALDLFACLFPSGRFAPRWMRWVLALNLIFLLLSIFPPTDSPLNTANWPPVLTAPGGIGFIVSVIFSQLYRYRRLSTPAQRQQTKWAIFGISLSLLLLIGLSLFGMFLPTSNQANLLAGVTITLLWPLFTLPIPIFIGLAILRSRLWDIDTVINRALVYGLLTGLLGALYAGLIIGLESLADALVGKSAQQPVVLVISTLTIAALFLPVRQRLQALVDRRFYRKKYNAEKTLAAFSATLRQEVDLEQLRAHLLTVVQEAMQPTQVSLWLRTPERPPGDPAYRLERPGHAPNQTSED